MSSLWQAKGPTFTIPNGTAVSNSIDYELTLQDAEGVTVFAPATLDVLTYTWEVSMDAGVTWKTLKDTSNTAIGVPAAASAITYNGIFGGYGLLRIKASGNVTAEKIFTTMKVWRGLGQ